MSDSKILRIKQAFDTYPDFPRPGILFYDIFPIFRDPAALDDLIGLMEEKIRANYPSAEMIAGLEARGFLFAPIVAQRLGIGFVPIRKGGKLPGETARISYSLEYGQDCFEIQRRAIRPGQKVLLLDDLLATGGSLRAACQLLKSVEAVCLGAVVVLELSELKGIKIVFLSFNFLHLYYIDTQKGL